MWPISAFGLPWGKRSLHIRLGRNSVECWQPSGSGPKVWSPLFRHTALNRHDSIQAVQQICRDIPRANVTCSLESALAPLALVDTGIAPLAEPVVSAHVRSRLLAIHSPIGVDSTHWETRMDWRAGERFALGYTLSDEWIRGLRDSVLSHNSQLKAIAPAFVWGMNELLPWKHWTQSVGWWIWQEEDRQIVSRLEHGRVVAMHPALPLVDELNGIRRQIGVEAMRWGISESAPQIAVGGWGLSPKLVAAGSPGFIALHLAGEASERVGETTAWSEATP